MQFERLKKALSTKLSIDSNLLDPEVGFKVAVNEKQREIRLTLISARHLPNCYGTNAVHGYIFKIKLFPGKTKFETELRTESWPTYNQSFIFKLDRAQKGFAGRFLVVTAYAILENRDVQVECDVKETHADKWKRMYDEKVAKFFQQKNGVKARHGTTVKTTNLTFERRRNVGNVTILLDKEKLSTDAGQNWISSSEIWRPLKNLNGTITENNADEAQGKKGELEIGLFYEKSSDNQDIIFIFSLKKLRCNIQLMQLQENMADSLYIKMKILNKSEVVIKGKTKRFTPSISHIFEPGSQLKSKFHESELERISFQISLVGRNRNNEKLTLGTINLSSNSKGKYLRQWEQALESSGKNIIQWQYLE